ncbi:MAG: outer membrane beta-barrel protein [Rhodothermales bacterium]
MTSARLPLLFLCLIGFTLSAQAQSGKHTVSGVVTDSLNMGLAGATVMLLESSDSTLVSYGITRSDGAFQLRRVPAGTYQMQITFVGFASYNAPLTLNEGDLDTGHIQLKEALTELDALVITADHVPMLIKQDTLEYNAAAFNVRPNANVEDLLRKLPGVEVERDGTIRAQGEEVEKVLVDGKEFFGNDPRIATQNLPADAVDKVQVYDKQSDMAEFTGIEDGEESRTINLALKEDSKQGYFGNVSGGLGDDELTSRYQGKANINRFSPTTQLSFIGNMNNINEQGFSMGNLVSLMGGIQTLMSGGFNASDLSMSNGASDGFSLTRAAGLNFNHDFNAKTSIQSSYFFNGIDNLQDRIENQQQLTGTSSASSSFRTSLQDLRTQNHRLSLNLKHELDESQDFRLRANLQASQSDLDNQSTRDERNTDLNRVNENTTSYISNGDENSGTARLTYRKKLAKHGRALIAEARGSLKDGTSGGNLEALNTFYDNLGNVMSSDELFQLQSQLSSRFTNQLKLSWTEPLGSKRYIEFHAERRQNSADQDKKIFDQLAGVNVINDLLSAALKQTYTYNSGGFNLQFNKSSGSFSIGVDLQQAQLKGDIQDEDVTIKNSSSRVLPSASYRHQFTGSKSLELRYRASTREPSMRELQPFADNSDPLYIYVGNPNLKPEYSHSGTIHFMLFDEFSFTNVFGYLRARYTTDKIASTRTIDEQLRQSISSTNVDGDWMLSGDFNFGTPLRPLGMKINVSTQTMYNRGFTFINNEENASSILRQSIDLKLQNRNKDLIDAMIGTRLTFNVTKYSLNPGLSQNYLNKTFYSELGYSPGNVWSFSTGLDYRVFADEVFGNGQQIPVWRAEISRMVMREKAEIKLVGVDLLNKNVSVNYSNTGNYIREEQINSLGRYVMLKFVYNLSGIGGRGTGIHFIGD